MALSASSSCSAVSSVGFVVFGAEDTSAVEPAKEGRKGADDSRLSRASRCVDLLRARLLVRITHAVGIADRTV